MTIIAARITRKSIEVAGDSQTTWRYQYKYPKKLVDDKSVKEFGKIFQVNGLTFGCAGQCSHIGLLQVYTKTRRPKEMERDAILDWLIEFKEWCLSKAKIPLNDLSFHSIIVGHGKAFTFFDHLEVYPINTFDAVGSGMFLAIGAMELGATVEQVVKVAIKYDLYCGGEVTKITIDTQRTQGAKNF